MSMSIGSLNSIVKLLKKEELALLFWLRLVICLGCYWLAGIILEKRTCDFFSLIG